MDIYKQFYTEEPEQNQINIQSDGNPFGAKNAYYDYSTQP